VNKKFYALRYLLTDIIASVCSWSIFYIYRKTLVEPHIFGYKIPLDLGLNFFMGVIFIPVFWAGLYYLSGFYRDPFHKSKLNEFGQTFIFSLVGVTILFFALILDDVIVSYKNYYTSFLVLFLLQFILTYIPRYIITARTEKKIREKIITFNTLLVGSSDKAFEVYSELESPGSAGGNKIVGFVPVGNGIKNQLDLYIPQLGSFTDLKKIVRKNNIEEVIIALESSEHQEINRIINILHECNVAIKAIPDLHDILTGKVKLETIYGAPLMTISRDLMPHWQASLKRIIDVAFSILALTVLSPLILFIIAGIKVTSKGPVFLRQERIGRYGKPFMLYKFRSMCENAETNGPELTKKNDPRLTPFGRFMRRRKLDEIPNFWNVIKGEMSLVGPRPERQYFIDKIVKKAPHYVHLHKVKPGITSWGQVRFGYAENVEQMIKRLEFDLIYIENMSLFVDFQILIYTMVKIFSSRHV
jgi:exopolysaccharide biosynthesis polyprenyl glycosylphosphotransferase